MTIARLSAWVRASIFVACLTWFDFAGACERAAGIVPFAVVDGQIQILIADHKINNKRGWAAFGGCVDEDESVAEGALRELHEETRCALDQTIALTPNVPRVAFGKFTSFALEVPFVSADTIQYSELPAQCSGPVIHERGPWAWVPLPDLLNQISSSAENAPFSKDFLPTAKTRWFWGKSSRVINALNELKGFK